MPKATTIEDQFRAIEEAVAALETGELPLEEALTRYEAGLKAVRAAKAQLDRYAARLTELRAEDDISPPSSAG
jgi:exodeoxyribonuclease VII small subunit